MGLIKLNGVNYWGSNYGAGILAPMIYSDEEREVGVWRDNKPLYQKTIDCGFAPNNTSKTVAHGISDIDEIVNSTGMGWIGGSGAFYPIPFVQRSSVGNQIQLGADRTNVSIATGGSLFTSAQIYVTLQYTKTTDVAGSGDYTTLGIPTVHYSTNEQVIGTWLGETLYEKTFTFGSNVQINMTSWSDVNTYIPNIGYKAIVGCKGYDNNGTFQGEILCGINASNHVQMQTPRNGNQYINVTIIVLQYTKTS